MLKNNIFNSKIGLDVLANAVKHLSVLSGMDNNLAVTSWFVIMKGYFRVKNINQPASVLYLISDDPGFRKV